MCGLGIRRMELDENGEGLCSVPMWQGGCPAGFCDEVAYGKPTKDGKRWYAGYVPGLACPTHGGPRHRLHKGDPCVYCGVAHDEVGPGPCPGRPKEVTGG